MTPPIRNNNEDIEPEAGEYIWITSRENRAHQPLQSLLLCKARRDYHAIYTPSWTPFSCKYLPLFTLSLVFDLSFQRPGCFKFTDSAVE